MTGSHSGSGLARPLVPDQVLDARDMRCPLPVLRARKALRALPPDAVLEVVSTDPASVEDFRRFAAQGAGVLLAQHAGDGLYRHWLSPGEE